MASPKALNFNIKTADGLLDRDESFNNMDEVEEKFGPYQKNSLDGIIKIIPKDKETKLAAEIRIHHNQNLMELAKNSPLKSNDPMFAGEKKQDVRDLIKGQLESTGLAQKGNKFWVKGNMLDIASKMITGRNKGNLMTECREGVDFIYDEVNDIGVIIDKLNSATKLGDLGRRPLVETVPVVMEYSFKDSFRPQLRINHASDSRTFAQSNLLPFQNFFVKEGRMEAENKTIDHPGFENSGISQHYTDLINKREIEKEDIDEPNLNIEKPSLRP